MESEEPKQPDPHPTPMEDMPEQPPVEEPPKEEPPPEQESAPPKKRKENFDASACEVVPAGGTCSNCDWDSTMQEPHPVAIMPQNVAVSVEGTVAPPEPPPPPEPDPKVCVAINPTSVCPKCGWQPGSTDPHPMI